jgi:hypothetical protein
MVSLEFWVSTGQTLRSRPRRCMAYPFCSLENRSGSNMFEALGNEAQPISDIQIDPYIYISFYILIYPLQLKPVVCCRSQESVALARQDTGFIVFLGGNLHLDRWDLTSSRTLEGDVELLTHRGNVLQRWWNQEPPWVSSNANMGIEKRAYRVKTRTYYFTGK